jgi:hypothetical protein
MSEQHVNPAAASLSRRVFALILDILTVFFLGGYLVGWLTGNLTPDGFKLEGASALILFAIIGAYFYVGRKIAAGTVWDRILGITRPQPY